MANNKMLIDASHTEETRVVVVRGNRIEEFDFEAQERKQLRGNIYLAKVTRVEPSLQAAFIDYGGNRHGFLAFSEIHPDYYQIPAADRQALLEAEADQSDDDDLDSDTEETVDTKADETSSSDENASTDEDAAEEKPKRKRRRSRKPKTKAADAEADAGDEQADAEKAEDAASEPSDDSSEDDGDDRTMAAMVETDSISEPAPEDEESSDENGVDDEPVSEEKPKRNTRRTTRRKKVKEAEEQVADTDSKSEDASSEGEEQTAASDEKPKRKKRATSRKKKVKEDYSAAEETASGDQEEKTVEASDESEEVKEKPKKRRRSRKKQAEATEGSDDNADPVEAVGQEDAMEEVPTRKKPYRQYKIQEVIRRRQVLLVQVVKEERGNKGAALTTYLSLAGRYSVLMPNTARGGGISRKITNPSDRKRLKEIAGQLDVPKGMGVILRTAGASRTNEEITRDFEYLMRLWENVRNLTLESSAPFLVYEEGSLIKRSIRDLYHKDIGEIIVSGEEGYNEARDFMNMMMPSNVKNVKLHRGEQGILSRFGVDAQLDKMLSPQVTMKSGGYLVINQTEALVAVDVNSGRSTREHSIEATALQTNLEAAEEVARQLRLRDLAGLVVIDFIDMEEKRNNRAVERKLKECLKNDRARIQVGHISHFGLMEMSRQRIRASVLESTMETCSHCAGIGHVRSQSSFAIQIVRALEEHLNKHSKFDLNVKVDTHAAMYILNNQRAALADLESRYGVQITIIADVLLEGQNYNIEKGNLATGEAKPRAAINPMDIEESSAPSDDETEGNTKRKRRRRGGRGKGRDKDNAQGDTETAEENSEAESALDNSNDDDVEEKVEKPKRGRRRTPKVEVETTEVAEKTETDVAEAPAHDTPAKPKRSTGRPGKKAKTEENAEPVVTEQAPESEAQAEEKPKKKRAPRKSSKKKEAETVSSDEAKPKRRTTRRVKAEKSEAESSSEDAPEKEKKSWWKGGGFFN